MGQRTARVHAVLWEVGWLSIIYVYKYGRVLFCLALKQMSMSLYFSRGEHNKLLFQNSQQST